MGRVVDGPNADNADRSPESRPVSVVGVVDIGAEAGATNAWNIIYLLAIFNVFIGVFNLAPLLPLDGGHVAIATYERIRSRNGRRHVVQTERLLPSSMACSRSSCSSDSAPCGWTSGRSSPADPVPDLEA